MSTKIYLKKLAQLEKDKDKGDHKMKDLHPTMGKGIHISEKSSKWTQNGTSYISPLKKKTQTFTNVKKKGPLLNHDDKNTGAPAKFDVKPSNSSTQAMP